MLALSLSAQAQTLYWDVNGNAVGSGPLPTGTWSTGTGSWNTNSSGTGGSIVSWSNGSAAVFSAGTNATGNYTVNVTGTVDVSGITVEEGNPTFNGGSIRFTGGAPQNFSVASGLVATVNSAIVDFNYSGLTKLGAGNLVLAGANTFQAPVTVSAGTLTLASNGALGATGTYGNTVASGATLALQGNITLADTGTYISGTGVSSAGAIRNVSGNNTYGGNIITQADSSITSAAGTVNFTGDLALNNNLTTSGAGNITFSGGGYGGGNITQNGSGTLTFSGATGTSLSGTLTINDGTVVLAKTGGANALSPGATFIGNGTGAAGSAVLRLEGSNQLADHSGLITIATDGLFNVNGYTEKIDRITSTGRIDLGSTGALTIGVNSGNSSLGGSVLGNGTLIKEGSGSLALLSSIVLAGELQLQGGTLLLSGYNLTVGTLHITGNSIIDFAGGNSTLNATNFVIDAGVVLTVQNWANAADFFYTQGWTGASFDASGSAPMNQVVFSGYSASNTHWQSYDHQITPVPEPSAYGALLMGGLGAFAAWRRFRQTRL